MLYLCLVIQKESGLARVTNRSLETVGLKPYSVATLEAALRLIGQWTFDVVMFDTAGFENGIEHTLSALHRTNVPVVVSTGPVEEEEQIRYLSLGATMVIVKPASMRYTGLRLRKLAEVRRGEDLPHIPQEVRLGSLLLDTRTVAASVGDFPLDLTPRQFELLLLLTTKAGRFVHRQTIATALSQRAGERSRSIDMSVSRIRSKLRDAGDTRLAVHTVHGRGYALTYESDAAKEEELSTWRA